ncbi:hypothetical protein C5167_039183 [Papaver somniferum]|uniref:Uncharacterized protein n=1 Tax=Papaver somniferum TaxID=3469 RepID=A0A4Y7IBD9_PAPSO|nr:hypothetical protein C5167_039183 [Papaver somniferum]
MELTVLNSLCFWRLWKPVSMGYKRRWWECVALPDDVDSCDETSFRMEIKELAFKSLDLLKKAIFDKECAPCILLRFKC